MRKLLPSYIRIPVLFFIIAGLVEYFVPSTGNQPAFMEQPVVLLFLLFVLFVLIAIEGIVSSIENILFQSLDEASKERYLASQKSEVKFTWIKNLYKKLTGNKPIEAEGEIILDHNYDGIKELDNSLPPWWVYGFYITIVFAVVYMARYHIFNADDQFVELEKEYAMANAAIEEYKKANKDLVDVNTVELLTEASDLNAGKKIFETNCAVCHMADGGGGIGPNLTDNYFILGGGIKNTFNTISEGGRSGKGMVPWKTELKPIEMAQVASYVLQFVGTTPANPKAPEGELEATEELQEQPNGSNEAETETNVEEETTDLVSSEE
ncbi:c-type cytochrome [Paucihalobacter ruber]|uniref:C-type cytochrome n=1 Tax=Paucihalobacter ruber TaxID=2567861 RepID=A0A506PHA2_9FLAO|nr:cbb3-type cytochrome c oxidase N-terminal domain-containing protein [Paucihalobacter ruber]TPV32954.1 c-type cytochrome [Paucihalobacter ruber]